jgi:hypothetical protein
VPEKPPISQTLRRTSEGLKKVRKGVHDDGYAEELQEIDALVTVAQQEADRKLAQLPVHRDGDMTPDTVDGAPIIS